MWYLRTLYNGNGIGISHYADSLVDWNLRRESVKETFVTSWNAYRRNAFGHDTFHPHSERGTQMSPRGLGWIIVDSLDTMMIMNLTESVAESREWLKTLTYDQDQEVNTFETTIRMLGGLLSAHYLASMIPGASSPDDAVYLAKATDLGNRLLPAYDFRSGIPYASVNLAKRVGVPSHTDGGASSLAEVGTVQLEMKNVMKVLGDNKADSGLLPIFVSPETGIFTTSEIRLGSRGDSYYEYLIKQYLQTSGQEPMYQDLWDEALSGIENHLITHSKHGLTLVGERPKGLRGPLSPKMDHLVCFLPGAIALGATKGYPLSEAKASPSWTRKQDDQMQLARDMMKTCWAMYAVTETGLAPEIAWFNTGPGRRSSNSLKAWKDDIIIKPQDAHNLQRPETVESLFVLWRITGDTIYREWAWKIYLAFETYTNLGGGKGYTSIDDVNRIPAPSRNNMESFWLAETLKYLYLTFSPRDYLPLHEVVFNTEAHVFPRLKHAKWRTAT